MNHDDDQHITWQGLMETADRTEDQEAAAKLYRSAADLAEQVFGPMSASTGLSIISLAYCLEALGRGAEAKPLYQRVRAILMKYAVEMVREHRDIT